MKFHLKLAACLGFVALQGCSSLSSSNDSQSAIGQLIIAEPVPVDYKSEVAIANLSQMILRAEITDVQKAQLYYERGLRYDNVGLRSLARLDFNLALRLKPDLVEAHNFIGIHFTQLQQFDQAYESFDATIELSPQHQYAYFNRGIALYYGGRPALAVEDFSFFYSLEKSDPYKLLWLYFAEQKVNDETAKKALADRATQVSNDKWAKDIIDLYTGKLSQSAFLARLPNGINSSKALTERLCEAYFYLGKFNQEKNQLNAAANFFKLTLGTNVYDFVEHRYAKLELDLMRAEYKRNNATAP